MFWRRKKITQTEIEARAVALVFPTILLGIDRGNLNLRLLAQCCDAESKKPIEHGDCPREAALDSLGAAHAAELLRQAVYGVEES